MKKCSIYCRPEEGIHAIVNWHDPKMPYEGTLEPGQRWLITTDKECMESGTIVEALSIEPAKEAINTNCDPEIYTEGWLFICKIIKLPCSP